MNAAASIDSESRLARQGVAVASPAAPAFTLTELLVVVAIISLLVSLAAAVMSRVRDRAKIVECATRLHAVGRGLAIYASEHEGRYPVGEMPLDMPQTELVSAMVPDLVPNGQVFYCPGEKKRDLQYSEENIRKAWIGYFYYSCRKAALTQSATSKVLRNFGAVTPNWPREIVATMPCDTWVMSDRWISGEAAHSAGKHGMNRLTLDGSVDVVMDSPAQVFR